MTRKLILSCFLLALNVLAFAQSDTTSLMRRLMAIKPLHTVQSLNSNCFREKYVMQIQQNLNGNDSSKGTFLQRIIVGVKGEDCPTVLVTEGYFAHYALSPDYEEELCKLFNANVIVCEHRYFGESVPESCDWTYLTLDNALHDLHHIRQVFDNIFHGKWISTGISKGGQTTMFYRATYPNDVDVSVSYVAPLNRGVEDGRHERFLYKKVGLKEERSAILNAQRELLMRKELLMPLFNQFIKEKSYHFQVSPSIVYDYCVLELPFALWQWGTPTNTIPTKEATDEVWFNYFTSVAGPDYFVYPSDFTPFFVQAARELGYYGYSTKGLKKFLTEKNTKGYLHRMMLPNELKSLTFDPSLFNRTVDYLKKNDPKHIFIYGEIDPWTASGVAGWLDCSDKHNMRVYIQPKGSHKARINNMPSDMKAEIMSRLSLWLGD